MKRLVTGITALCIGMALCAPSPAWAKKKSKHHKTRYSAVNSNPLAGLNTAQPDAQLFNRAMKAMRKGRYDVARLDLQTLLNAYPSTEYAMRAKLAIGDSWYLEGGPAALEQAASEYRDFITFFPNTPEAAEAQMKIGDISYQQMERPDRDPTNALKAEKEYRAMIEQFPDSPLVPRAQQKLRDVQEVLAEREFEVGQFYATRQDWPGSIARLQSVADLYPLFSKSCATLIQLGDDYANEAAQVQNLKKFPVKARKELLTYYNDRAAAAWDRAITHYPMSASADLAKDRLIAMGRPIPQPTADELAESEAMEASRSPVKFKTRALDIFSRAGATPVQAARVGQPTLTDVPQTYAPSVARQQQAVFIAALHGKPLTSAEIKGPQAGGSNPENMQVVNPGSQDNGGDNTVAPAATFETVPTGNSDANGDSATVEVAPSTASGNAAPAGAQLNGQVVTSPNSTPLAAAVGPNNPAALPAVQKPEAAPDQVNDVKNGGTENMAAQNTSGKKKKKSKFDKKAESSSRHKSHKGLGKLNPF